MNILDVLAVLFDIHAITQEYLMIPSDFAGIASLLIMGGGVFFWLMLMAGIVLSVCRGISRLYWFSRDVIANWRTRTAE